MSIKQIYLGRGSQTLSPATDNFCPFVNIIGLNADETQVRYYIRNDTSVFSNMGIYVNTNTLSVNGTLNFRKNGANGNQTISVTASTTGAFEDNTNTDSTAIDDYVNMEWVCGAGTGSANAVDIYITQNPNSNFRMYRVSTGFGNTLVTSTGGVRYATINGDGTVNATIANVEARFRQGGTLKYSQWLVTANLDTGGITNTIQINGSNGNNAVSIAALTTGYFQDTSSTDAVSSGDKVAWKLAQTTTGTITYRYIDISFISSDSAKQQTIAQRSPAAGVADAADVFSYLFGNYSFTTPESLRQRHLYFGYTVQNIEIYISVNATTSASTVNFRVAGATSALTFSITLGTTGYFSDLTHTVSGSSGDLVNIEIVNGGGGSLSVNFIGIVMQEGTGATNVTVSPSVLSIALNLQAPVVSFGSTISPSVLSIAENLISPVISGGANISPSVLSVGLNLQTPTVSFGSTISPSVLSIPINLQAPVISGDANLSPSVLSIIVGLQAPTEQTGIVVSPSVLSIALNLISPTLIIEGLSVASAMLQRLIQMLAADSTIASYVGTRIGIFYPGTVQDYAEPQIRIKFVDSPGRFTSSAFMDAFNLEIALIFPGFGAQNLTWDDVFKCHKAMLDVLHRYNAWTHLLSISIIEVTNTGNGPQQFFDDGSILYYPSRWRVVATI